MRILIIDQCSSSKAAPDWFDPFNEAAIDDLTRKELLEREQVPTLPAHDLYTGQQQRYITQAVDRLRAAGDSVDRVFISAGFGVVDEEELLPPYDATFSGRSDSEIIRRSRALGVEDDLEVLLSSNPRYDAVFFALGHDYVNGLDIRELLKKVDDSTAVALFNRELDAEHFDNVISIPARTDQARENGDIVVALKGRFIRNFAEHRERGATVDNLKDLYTYCMIEVTSQSELEEFDG